MLSMYPGNRKMNIILMYLEINVFFSTFQEVKKNKINENIHITLCGVPIGVVQL